MSNKVNQKVLTGAIFAAIIFEAVGLSTAIITDDLLICAVFTVVFLNAGLQ